MIRYGPFRDGEDFANFPSRLAHGRPVQNFLFAVRKSPFRVDGIVCPQASGPFERVIPHEAQGRAVASAHRKSSHRAHRNAGYTPAGSGNGYDQTATKPKIKTPLHEFLGARLSFGIKFGLRSIQTAWQSVGDDAQPDRHEHNPFQYRS